ncbi:hypothetical protein [Actinoallomurus iriomotensis]|uniref:Uncharacterized protein n=1 Tax=Actinoallomurus iriomotensis TaxID=478107 RepID=A0A9W6RXS7_9ACTN|nr:hypothetical protein [Actinoallomurus iriomotensis]GLY83563.1 hypothetical protein Airi02_014930 [Actinoallomurus iriomotensis]
MSLPSARRSKRTGRTARAEETSGAADQRAGRVEAEELAGRFLLSAETTRAEGQADLVTAVEPGDATLVVVAVPDDLADGLWPRLAEVLTRARERTGQVVLAMSGAGIDRQGSGALARRIADDWDMTVVAPAGDVLLVPGGALFVRAEDDGPEPRWWRFAPKTEAQELGLRWPRPEWEAALADVTVPSGVVVTAVPAGALVRPVGTPEPDPGDVAYAIPADPERPAVLVGDAEVSAADLVAVLSGAVGRAEWRRQPVRLVPAGDVDLLPLGQAVARELGVEVEVLTGPPVGSTGDTDEWRTVLLDAGGRPTWSPFVASVLCGPAGRDGVTPPPRPLNWRSPAEGMRVADAARGVLRLDDTWRVAVTRAGVWAYPVDADPDRFPDRLTTAWPVSAGTLRVDVGASGRTVDDRLWTPLDGLLDALTPGPHARLHLAVHGRTTPDGAEAVQRLATRHHAGLDAGLDADRADRGQAAASPEQVSTMSNGSARAHVSEDAVHADVGGTAAVSAVRTEASVALPGAEEGSAPVTPPATRTPTESGAVTVTPEHRSTDEDRAAFRAMVGLGWDAHAAPVRRTFSRLPAIAATERAAAAVDLVAVRLFLTSPADGAFGPAAARSGDAALRPYLACLASGLGRLPTYRGAVLHGVDAPARTDLTGTVLTEPGPVGGLSLADGASGWPPTATVYVIWSDTARRVAALSDAETEKDVASRRGDVVFGPGSRFAVLDVRPGDADTPDLVLLRELPATHGNEVAQGGHLALTRLNKALEGVHAAAAGAPPWPAHSLGPLGTPSSASGHATA